MLHKHYSQLSSVAHGKVNFSMCNPGKLAENNARGQEPGPGDIFSCTVSHTYRQFPIHVTCPTHARMHSWRNGACIISKTSCLQVRPRWPILRRSNYSIADYTCLMCEEQIFPPLGRKALPKHRLPLHFLAQLRSLRTPPPTTHCSRFHNHHHK